MRPVKNGYYFEEAIVLQDDEVSPYKLWSGDLYRCPNCNHEVIVGVGAAPIAEHFQPDYAEKVKAYKSQLQVVD